MYRVITVDGFAVPMGSHEGKKVIMGADHRGHKYWCALSGALKGNGLAQEVEYVGTYSDERCDYPEISQKIARRVAEHIREFDAVGIGLCGSGIGMAIPASKYPGIYVASCITPEQAATSRRHNNTNFLGIGTDMVDEGTAIRIAVAWMSTPFCEDPERDAAYLNRYLQTLKAEEEAHDLGRRLLGRLRA